MLLNTVEFGYASVRLLNFQPAHKMWTPNSMVTKHNKKDCNGQCMPGALCHFTNNKKKYYINEQMQNDEIYFCTKLRSFFHIEHRQSNMNYRFTSSIFWTTVCLIEGIFWTQKQNTLSWRSCGTIDFITVISIIIFRKCTSSSRKQCDIQANNIYPQIIWSTYLCWKIQ